jgi:hypothetical protein
MRAMATTLARLDLMEQREDALLPSIFGYGVGLPNATGEESTHGYSDQRPDTWKSIERRDRNSAER